VDPVAGVLVWKADRGAQGYRWLHVTAVCATGAYLGLRRLVNLFDNWSLARKRVRARVRLASDADALFRILHTPT
jgi:hypothetical protein